MVIWSRKKVVEKVGDGTGGGVITTLGEGLTSAVARMGQG
jgi:hypothetical protein